MSGFGDNVRLGLEHVALGADHLLFVLTLLIAAPHLLRAVHVVTAFAIGHSITLALAATGAVHVPAGPVELVIALSIAVSAVHAVRPLVPGGEPLFAAAFGLVHGLAFAALFSDLGLGLSSLVAFNVGIELAQLLVVALFLPSLWLLARTRFYPAVRTGLAGLAFVAACGWTADRAGMTADPFAGITTALVEHPFTVAACFAAFAAALSTFAVDRQRT